MSVTEIVTDAAGGFLEYISIGILGAVGLLLKVPADNRKRSKENTKELGRDGDPDEPSRLDKCEERIGHVEKRQDGMELHVFGDDDNPAFSGALEDVHHVSEEVHEVSDAVSQLTHHVERVDEKLEQSAAERKSEHAEVREELRDLRERVEN